MLAGGSRRIWARWRDDALAPWELAAFMVAVNAPLLKGIVTSRIGAMG
jgi:hypothetical protein